MKGKYFVSLVALFLVFSMVLVSAGSYVGKFSVDGDSGSIIISGPGQLPTHYCGNGILEAYPPYYEQCDGQDLGSETCSSLNSDWEGNLDCKYDCTFDTSECSVIQDDDDNGNGGGGSSSGGRGSSSSSNGITTLSEVGCVENWKCDDWSECNEEKQARECSDINVCGSESVKPAEERECEVEVGSEEGFFSRITGAVVGGGMKSLFPIIFILIIIVAALSIYFKKKRKAI